jgi:hypothetical protein
MRSESTFAQNRAVAPEARRDLTDMSDGDMPAAEPKAAAVRRKVVVKCLVVTASHVLV